MWSLQDAKNGFSAVVEAALGGQPQRVSRRGKPAVVVISVADYERLVREAGAHRGSFRAHVSAFPATDMPRLEARPRGIER